MKSVATLVSALAIASAFTAAPVLAQETTHMINGKAVSALQLPAVQQKCDELSANNGAAAAANANTPPAAEGGGNDNNAAAAGGGADAGAGGNAAAGAAPSGNNPGGSASDNDIDVANLTLAQCEEGGFTPKM
jgi:hypothetical protein